MSILNLFPFASGIDVATMAIGYTGTKAGDAIVTMSGVQYRLLTLTSSGTLTLEDAVNADICVVGGGAAGAAGVTAGQTSGAGGAGAKMSNGSLTGFSGGAAVIGAAQGASSIGGVVAAAVSGANGGSGGGAEAKGGNTYQNPGTGDGQSKYPFGDTAYWSLGPHCAGGGGGASLNTYNMGNTQFLKPPAGGGTNGSNGLSLEGSGGVYGGGSGGSINPSVWKANPGSPANYYGSGGGGGSSGYFENDSNGRQYAAAGGAGYQGVIYVRIPLDQ